MAQMVYLIFASDGHGKDTSGKRSAYIAELKRQIRENEFNAPTTEYLIADLKRSKVVVVHVSAGDSDVALRTRTDHANRVYKEYVSKYGKANVKALYVSIHFNALDGKFDGPGKDPEGFSLHIHPGSTEGRKAANAIAAFLKQGTAQKYRGIVEQNLHETRETNMPAVLIECGFMDNKREALLMLVSAFQKEVATETAQGVCKYFGISYIAPAAPKPAPKPAAKPVTSKEDTHRIIVDGKQVAALSNDAGVLAEIDKYMNKHNKVTIERV